jgi:hypothetical protein
MVSWAGPVVLARFSYGRGVAVERGMYCGALLIRRQWLPANARALLFVLPPEAEVEDQVVDGAGRVAATRTAASSRVVG